MQLSTASFIGGYNGIPGIYPSVDRRNGFCHRYCVYPRMRGFVVYTFLIPLGAWGDQKGGPNGMRTGYMAGNMGGSYRGRLVFGF